MKIKNLLILYLFIIASFLFNSCNGKSPFKIINSQLSDSITTIQDYSPIFFHKISDVFIKNNKIAFIDMGNHRVILKNYFGRNEIKPIVFGREGRGPGEFLAPKSIFFNKANIYVADLATQSISIFDSTGKFKNYINAKVKLNFAVNSKSRIFIPNVDPDYIITEYDSSGNIISRFVKKINFENDNINYNHNHVNILIDNKDNLYLVFFDYPIIRKYNKNMELIWEENINYLDEINKTYQKNLKIIIDEPFTLKGLLKDVSLDEQYLYIHCVAEKNSKYDIIRIDKDSGKFSGYIDIPDGTIIIEKFVVYKNHVIGIDFRNKIFIFELFEMLQEN